MNTRERKKKEKMAATCPSEHSTKQTIYISATSTIKAHCFLQVETFQIAQIRK